MTRDPDDNEMQELLRLASDPATTEHALWTVLDRGAASMEVARRVARHPNCPRSLLYTFMRFQIDDVRQSSAYAALIAEDPEAPERLANNVAWLAPRPLVTGLSDQEVDPGNPLRFKVEYFLKRGRPADIRFLVRLDRVADELVAPFLTHRDVHVRRALAGRKTLPEEGFEALATDHARTVRLALAANPAAPAKVLSLLSEDAEADVRSAVLANSNCPPAVIQRGQLETRAAAMRPATAVDSLSHAACRSELADAALAPRRLIEFGCSTRPFVRAAAGVHPNAPEALLHQLATDLEPWVRSAAAFHPATPVECLNALTELADPEVQMGLACNPATPTALQLRLAQTGDAAVRRALADVTEDAATLQALCKPLAVRGAQAHWQEVLKLVLNPQTKAQKLRSLHRRADIPLFANKFAARHTNAPKSLLGHYAHYLFDSLAQNPAIALKLLEDPNAIKPEPEDDWKVNQWLSESCAPGHVANQLAQHGDADQQRRVVSCPALPPQRLLPLMFSEDLHLLKRLAERKTLPRIVLEWLGRHEKEVVRERIASHAAASATLLAELVQDPANAVRAAALQHPAYLSAAARAPAGPVIATLTPVSFKNKGLRKDRIRMANKATVPDVLIDLATDKDEEVRHAVLRNKNTPLAALDLLAHDVSVALRRELAWSRVKEASERAHTALLQDLDEGVRASAMRALARWVADIDRETGSNRLQAFLRALRHREEAAAREVLAQHTTDTDLQQELLSEGEAVLLVLAKNPQPCVSVLERLSTHNSPLVRAALAQHTSDIGSYLLLLDDQTSLVAEAARENRIICRSPLGLRAMAEHLDPSVRSCAAFYLSVATADVARKLALDDDIEVLETLARYGDLPTDVRASLINRAIPRVLASTPFQYFTAEQLACLSKHANPDVRVTMARYWPNDAPVPKGWHERFVDDPSPQVRRAAVESGELSNGALRKLAADLDSRVREAARYLLP